MARFQPRIAIIFWAGVGLLGAVVLTASLVAQESAAQGSEPVTMDWSSFLTSIIGTGVLVAGLTQICNYLLARRKLQADGDLAEVQRLVARVSHLESLHEECLENSANQQRELGALQAIVYKLEGANVVAHIVADEAGVITDWSPGSTFLFGWSHQEAVGCSLTLIIPERFRSPHTAAYRQNVEHSRAAVAGASSAASSTAGAVTRVRETYGLHRNGSEIPIRVELGAGFNTGEKRFYTAEIKRR